jgi:eukaryotic-like serine/threonine-protein kinase
MALGSGPDSELWISISPVDNQSGTVANLLKLLGMSEQQGTWVVPGYVAEGLIGLGASGEVWRGRATDTGQTVALKRLRPGATDLARRLERQATLLAAVDHPNLLPVRELVSTPHETVLVLDHATGGSLASLLRRRGRLRPGEVVTVVAPVAAALAHAHDLGLVHGAVSPANVLFTADGRPLLADLGIARALRDGDDPQRTAEHQRFREHQRTSEHQHTSDPVDPAVAAGTAADPADDVFTAAAVAVHALTGARPWRSAGGAGQAPASTAAEWIPDLRRTVADMPEPLLRALQRALSVAPRERGSAAELALDLRRACPPEPVRLVSPARTARTVGRDAGPDAAGARAARAARAAPSIPPGTVAPAGRPTPRHRRDDRHRRGSSTGPAERWSPRVIARRRSRSRSVMRGVGVAFALLSAALLGMAWAAEPADRHASLTTARPQVAGTPATTSATDLALPGRAGPSAPEPTPPEPTPPTRPWLRVLAALDGVRARAYERGEAKLLEQVYVPGQHLRADVAQLRALTATGETARGVRHRLGPAQVVAVSDSRVRLRVVQALLPSQRLRRGDVVAAIPGTPESVVLVDLVATPGGWRLA